MHSKFTGHQQNRLKTVALMMYSDVNIGSTGYFATSMRARYCDQHVCLS